MVKSSGVSPQNKYTHDSFFFHSTVTAVTSDRAPLAISHPDPSQRGLFRRPNRFPPVTACHSERGYLRGMQPRSGRLCRGGRLTGLPAQSAQRPPSTFYSSLVFSAATVESLLPCPFSANVYSDTCAERAPTDAHPPAAPFLPLTHVARPTHSCSCKYLRTCSEAASSLITADPRCYSAIPTLARCSSRDRAQYSTLHFSSQLHLSQQTPKSQPVSHSTVHSSFPSPSHRRMLRRALPCACCPTQFLRPRTACPTSPIHITPSPPARHACARTHTYIDPRQSSRSSRSFLPRVPCRHVALTVEILQLLRRPNISPQLTCAHASLPVLVP